MRRIELLGSDWLTEEVGGLTDSMSKLTPSQYNEENRYLPASVTSSPGYIRYAVNPFMREIVDCFDVNSPIREVNVMKGVQITYSTVLESGVLYYADYIGTLPIMYMTADKELAQARVENNFLPMFQQSGKSDVIRSSDTGNSRKTGKTKDHLQFAKGGYMVPFGARNADKMRSYSIAVMLKDEIDAWPDTVGKDGDPDALSDARTDGYTEQAKIFRGSTPLIKGASKIHKGFLRGDQRVYRVLCKHCNAPQVLRWRHKEGALGGFRWETNGGSLILDSVHYCCTECGHPHYEYDKQRLFAEEHGAHWHPTATPADPFIRSYHLPALYSPVGMRPWWKCVSDWLDAWDVEANRVRDTGRLQVFYNNVLAEPFEIMGAVIRFEAVSAHRRTAYRYGEVPNAHAVEFAGGPILMLTCQVDVHRRNLAVSVMGWTAGMRCYLVDYWRFEHDIQNDDDEGCADPASPVWGRLRALIEETVYTADDGKEYPIGVTLVDAGYATDTVVAFCADYGAGVYPILGRDRPAKYQTVKEFAEFQTQQGTVGYRILVDHYKDRLAPVLRREWSEDAGEQREHHFNAPIDATDKQLKELTRESRREKRDPNGNVSYYWHRPGNAEQELWDLLGYGHAAVEIVAWQVCRQHFELPTVDWPQFWAYIEENQTFYSEP